MRKIYFLVGFILISLTNCSEETMPKPKAYLRLDFPVKSYQKLKLERPYVFDIANNTKELSLKNNWMKVLYPNLKASVDITYRPIKNNLKELLMESEKLVFEHTVKASEISSKNFSNSEKKVYGKLFDIFGNTASQVQFHVTDSTKHFLKASLFFRVKPNYDSILPAVDYIKKDMIRMMESLEWKK